jgi:hypothetical protein
MRNAKFAAAVLAAALPLAALPQQPPVAYPAKGQTAARQSKDEADCGAWAKNKSGVDPAQLAANPPPQESGSTLGGGERARGAARGAVGGAAIGAIAGDTGKGAGAGAVLGTMRGGREARQNQSARNQSAQQQHSSLLDSYYRAYSACMSGRGYTMG